MSQEEYNTISSYLSSKEDEVIHIGLTLLNTFNFYNNSFFICELIVENLSNIQYILKHRIKEFEYLSNIKCIYDIIEQGYFQSLEFSIFYPVIIKKLYINICRELNLSLSEENKYKFELKIFSL